MDKYIPMPADLIFTSSPKLLGKLIGWFSQSRDEDKTYARHEAGIGLNNNVVEALTTVVSTPWLDWQPDCSFEVWRNYGINPKDREIIAGYAEDQIGRKYGYAKLILHALDCMVGKISGGSPYIFRRLAFMDNYPICSWLWAYAYNQISLWFGGSPRKVSPDDKLDYISNSPTWKMVYKYYAGAMTVSEVYDGEVY